MIVTKSKLEEGCLFKISRFKEVIKKTSPHKHGGYFELIYLQEGEGFHWVETTCYQISAPEIYFLKPGQLHHWQFTAIPKGFVILVKETYFDPVKEASLVELMNRLRSINHFVLHGRYQPGDLFEEMFREYTQDTAYSEHVICGYLRVIFSKLLQLSRAEDNKTGIPGSLYRNFLDLLSSVNPGLHKVRDYAALLNISPDRLNKVCRKNSAKSAGEHISAQLLLEAKRYILHTDKTINEIAHMLHFNDGSYFVKFFKKHEKMTPGEFRERHLMQKHQ